MRRPLCLFGLTFVVVLVLCMRLMPMPVPDYGIWDGQHFLVEGQVYQKEYRSLESYDGTRTVLILYLKSIHILDHSNDSAKIPHQQLRNIMCYMETGTEPAIGSTVRVEGDLQCFRKATNPGEFDVRSYYHIMKLDFKLNKARLKAYSLEHDGFRERLYLLKNKLGASLDNCFGQRDASVMKAMLLGDTGNLDKEIKQLYQQSGIIHILAISGLHISIIGMGLHKLLIRCGIPPKLSVFISASAIWCYGIMTGMSASAVRAIIMFALNLTARIIGRTYDMLTALTLAAVLLLIEQPRYVEHSGFLFSFGAIAAIGVLLPVLEGNGSRGYSGSKNRDISSRFQKNMSNLLYKFYKVVISGIAVALVQFPVHLVFYYQFPVCSVFLNLIVIPLATILMYNGMFCMFAGSALPFIVKKTAYINAAILFIYEKCCMLCQQAAYGNIIAGQPETWQVEVYVLMLVILSVIGKKMSSWWKWQWVMLALALLMFRGNDGLSVTAIDVGQGDGIHIRSGTGKHYLIDGGSSTNSDVGNYQLLPYLKSQGAGRLAAVFVTHADEDHLNGVQTLIEASGEGGVKIECLILPDINPKLKNEAYEKLEKSAEDKGIGVKYMSRGQYVVDGGMKLACLHPAAGCDMEKTNEYSLVLYLTYGGFKALFTGDVEGLGEEMMKRYMKDNSLPEGELTLLKAAHHGSRNSTDEELLDILDPQVTFISCGAKNRYGHPHPELLARLEKAGSEVYITKDKGAVTIYTDGKLIKIKSFQ